MAIRGRVWWLAGFTAGWVAVAACGGSSKNGTPDGGEPINPPDATVPVLEDAGVPGEDASEPPDAAAPGADAAIDYFGKPGPWPTDPVTAFLPENTEILDVSTDEAQNIWAVSNSALYLLQPGQTQFKKYTGADGLFVHADSINAVAGGAAGEVFVGYQGVERDNFDVQHDPDRFRGKLDRVQLQPDGSLKVTFYPIHNNDAVNTMANGACVVNRGPDGFVNPNDTDWSYNEDRTVMRMLYDHRYHRGTMYVGYMHGVDRIDPGKPDPITGQDFADHVHPEVINPLGTKRMGEWRALALDPSTRAGNTGVLWMGGRWTAGARRWTDSLFEWTNANYDCPPDYPKHQFLVAFSNASKDSSEPRPVFQVTPGDSIYLWGIAPLSDGTVYFASGQGYDAQYAGPFGIAMWQGGSNWTYLSPSADLGLPGGTIVDMQRAPDDTILLAFSDGSLWRWNPNPKPKGANLGRITGLPAGATRIYVDGMTDPPAVYVATYKGFALVRLPAKP
ncbi:MAG TPA: hypothetical protein VGK67_04535 [Myxococcales bacterium]|jgi:hypothetical protein